MFLYCIFDGQFGVVVGILANYARGHGFNSHAVQIFVRLNMVCLYWV
jgi:hypothetical protein